jgi:hypothetical protein
MSFSDNLILFFISLVLILGGILCIFYSDWVYRLNLKHVEDFAKSAKNIPIIGFLAKANYLQTKAGGILFIKLWGLAVCLLGLLFLYTNLNSTDPQVPNKIVESGIPMPTPKPIVTTEDIEESISYQIPEGWVKMVGSYPDENYINLSPADADRTKSHPFIQISKIINSSTLDDIKKDDSVKDYQLIPLKIDGKEALTHNNKDYNWNYTTMFLVPDGKYVWKIFAGDVVKRVDDSYKNYPLLTNFLSSIKFK